MQNEDILNVLGKIEDAGTVVYGGKIDKYWDKQGLTIDLKEFTGDSSIQAETWLHDSETALKYFNLRSIEFGNWMSQQDRANFLYAAMLGLHDLSVVLGVQPKEMGLSGKLSIALGARGSGGAMGHYESTPYSVINLTKTNGMHGVLAHEYAHAMDNIISFHTKSKQKFVSGGRTTRKGFDENIANNGNYFEQQFENFFNILYFNKEGNPTDFQLNIKKKDEYWNRRLEVLARTFEVYVTGELKKKKIRNKFLSKTSYISKAYPSVHLTNEVAPIIKTVFKRGFFLMKKNKSSSLSGINLPIEGYQGFRKVIRENASLSDTLTHMKHIVYRDKHHVEVLAKKLEGVTVKETAENIWDFIRENFTYKEDKKGEEELRTPSRTLTDEIFDCDDATILASAMLLTLGIDNEFRITSYKEKGKFTHIYPVAFDNNGREYVIDSVPEIPHFNYEEQPIIDLKRIPMKLVELSGIDNELADLEIQQDLIDDLNEPFSLSGIDDEFDNEDEEDEEVFEEMFLQGLGEVDTVEEADVIINSKEEALQLLENGVLAEVSKARESLIKEQMNPTILSQTINVNQELERLDNLMELWDNEGLRADALKTAIEIKSSYKNFYRAIQMSLEQLSNEAMQLSGFDDDQPIYLAKMDAMDLSELMEDEFEEEFDDEDFEGEDELAGRRSRRRKRRKRRRRKGGFLKRTFKKVGKLAKKTLKAVVRFNPATIVLRNAILLVLKLNVAKISSRLIYGYLTREQAQAKNLDLGEWSKIVRIKTKAEKLFKNAGGKKKNFRNAIVKGRGAKKASISLNGLGAVATSSTAAASGFIAKMVLMLKKVSPKILVNKIQAKIQERKTRRAERKSDAQTQDIQIVNDFVPEGEAALENDSTTTNTDHTNTNTTMPQEENTDEAKTSIKDKLFGFFERYKKKIIGGGIVLVVIILGAIFWRKGKKASAKKKKNQLSGIKAAKTRARNRRAALKGLPAPSRRVKTAKRKPKTLGRGNTTVIRTPSKGRGKTRVRKESSKDRLSLMHAKAKQLQKKHPKTKYSKLLSMASKQI